MIDDGYTETWKKWRFRRFLGRFRPKVFHLVRNEMWDELDELMWNPPYVWGGKPKSDEDRGELFQKLMGYRTENEDFLNLKRSTQILFSNPLLGRRSCSVCKEWWFDEDTGLVATNSSGPIRRPKHAPVACETDRGCPKGHYRSPVEMSEKNRKAFRHFIEWRATGLTDEQKSCPIVRRNWTLMERMVSQHGLPKFCS